MFEQDYIMRLIRELIRALIKLIFNVDTETPSEELMKQVEDRAALDALMKLLDAGKINEAENMVYELTEERDQEALKAALLFYARLNEQSDEFLESHDFSRQEVKDGLKVLVSRYGLGSMAEMFLEE